MTPEELYEEMEASLIPYRDIIHDLELFKLTTQQVSNVLLLIYQYRFVNAVDNTPAPITTNGGW